MAFTAHNSPVTLQLATTVVNREQLLEFFILVVIWITIQCQSLTEGPNSSIRLINRFFNPSTQCAGSNGKTSGGGGEGTGFVRALRSLLTSYLPKFQHELECMIHTTLDNDLKDVRADGVKGYTHAKIFPLMKSLVTKVNCFIFFGEDLSRNVEFTSAGLEFPQTVVFAAELLRISPECIRPLVASIATNRHKAAKTLYQYLVPVVEHRIAIRHSQPRQAAPTDCMQWLIDTSPRKNPWPAERICPKKRRQASAPRQLHQRINSHHQLGFYYMSEEGPRSLHLSDGSYLNRGDWVCVPQRAMMQDSARYADANRFDSFRFASQNALLRQQQQSADVPGQKESKLTDASPDWPIWESEIPLGRFYASLVTKLVVIRILEDWECKMLDPDAPRYRTWRSSIVPRSSTIVMFCKRQHKS
ncbi:uncharacterized protein TRIREDRAFT_109147 [Trichoderma reesei QM6a]|uniref:Predicted protein n=2 Tax=Hypocrea jecorina TaxID=51453 RepID=G0RNA6_HYPJQ|nr:uncharacterized protein TRIREDRAFT_109147 [Trichoderma reesei QM6a]EGR47351.1 predicted protein [Trichoderma reesei QM6a]ETS00746.1 hypothetical protein M419DRAFT_131395 [Trichoderma reesei RUT C-30]